MGPWLVQPGGSGISAPWPVGPDRSQGPIPEPPFPAGAEPALWAAPVASLPAERAVQMHNRYLVVETTEGIEVIDQHALHERVLYESLKASVAAGNLEVQPLLIPEPVELAPADLEVVTEHAGVLGQAGLRIEPFGGSTVIVTSKPVLAGNTPAEAMVREIVERLAALSTGADSGMLVDEVLHGLACRAAIKAGNPLSQPEIDALVRDRHSVGTSHHCPHGRPTSLTLSRQELDRQFRRT